MTQENKYENSRPFDVWMWGTIPAIKKTADLIYDELYKKTTLRLRSKKQRYRIKNHLKVILTDLYIAHKEDNKRYLSFSRSKGKSTPKHRWKKLFINPEIMAELTDFLCERGYIELILGFYDRERDSGYNSRMKATEKLVATFRRYKGVGGKIINRRPEIILRDGDKTDIDYDPLKPEILRMAKNVRTINKFLARHEITLDAENISPEDYKEAQIFITGNRNTKYTRIFNDGSFNFGGRFFCHWSQMIKKRLRENILIDGKKTVELDFSCLHITMLYCLKNLTPPEGDLYNLMGIDIIHRKIIKKAFNIAINSSSVKQTIQAINCDRRKIYSETGIICPPAKELLSAIEITHPEIKEYLCTGYGVSLQRYESDLAEQIMLSLISQNIPVLTIHDSFICPEEYKLMLQDTMKYYFYNKFNIYPKIK